MVRLAELQPFLKRTDHSGTSHNPNAVCRLCIWLAIRAPSSQRSHGLTNILYKQEYLCGCFSELKISKHPMFDLKGGYPHFPIIPWGTKRERAGAKSLVQIQNRVAPVPIKPPTERGFHAMLARRSLLNNATSTAEGLLTKG